jgi:hypothetical protein
MSYWVDITDLKVHVCQKDGSWMWLPVKKSAYATGGLDDFEDYHELLKLHLPPESPYELEMSWDQFQEVRWSIICHGFKIMEPPITLHPKFKGLVVDGQHRLAVLYQKFGENCKLEIEDNKVIGVWGKLNV